MNVRVCGVGIKGADASLVIVDFLDGELVYVDQGVRKLTLTDDRLAKNVQSFASSVESFAHENKIDAFAIKSRSTKGQMKSGGLTFKIEGLFQIQKTSLCVFVSPQALTSVSKTNFGALPSTLFKYQNDSYLAAAAYLKKN